MLTYDELRSEECYTAQKVPPTLKVLYDNLITFYGDKGCSINVLGDNRDTKGYHRSRRWIRASQYCTDRHFSITETDGNVAGGNDDWISGIRLVLGKGRVMSANHAVIMAQAHGAIPYVRTVYVTSSPWTLNIGFDRGMVSEPLDELYRVLTGTFAVREPLYTVELDLPTLRQGSHGGYVITAQHLLGARGFPLAADGNFGHAMHDRTVAMQRMHGMKVHDGVWNPETWTVAITGADQI